MSTRLPPPNISEHARTGRTASMAQGPQRHNKEVHPLFASSSVLGGSHLAGYTYRRYSSLGSALPGVLVSRTPTAPRMPRSGRAPRGQTRGRGAWWSRAGRITC